MKKVKKKKKETFDAKSFIVSASMGCNKGLVPFYFLSQLQTPQADLIILVVTPAVSAI